MPFPKYAVSPFKGLFVYFQEETQDSWKPEGVWGEWDYSDGCMQRQAGPSLPEPWSCSVSEPGPHPLTTFTTKPARTHRVIWLWVHQHAAGLHQGSWKHAPYCRPGFPVGCSFCNGTSRTPSGLTFSLLWELSLKQSVEVVVVQSTSGSWEHVVGSGCYVLCIEKGRLLKHFSSQLEL